MIQGFVCILIKLYRQIIQKEFSLEKGFLLDLLLSVDYAKSNYINSKIHKINTKNLFNRSFSLVNLN